MKETIPGGILLIIAAKLKFAGKIMDNGTPYMKGTIPSIEWLVTKGKSIDNGIPYEGDNSRGCPLYSGQIKKKYLKGKSIDNGIPYMKGTIPGGVLYSGQINILKGKSIG